MLRSIVLIAVLVFSCKIQKSGMPNSGMNMDDELTLLLEDGYFATDEQLKMVIKDQKSLNGFFAKVNRTRKPGLSVPVVDFKKNMILVFCASEQKGIERLELFKTNETDDTVEISIKKVENKDLKTQVSYPFCVYTLPTTNKAVIFID